jgi:hypothetical protein
MDLANMRANTDVTAVLGEEPVIGVSFKPIKNHLACLDSCQRREPEFADRQMAVAK